ncbi:MAG: hypothetical protein IJW62_07665 [Clostridia bacterium]|nr:hypothetical protein [Clostridia bacterium]
MKKKRILLLCLFVLLSSMSLSVFAHRGGTDSNGGHYDGDDYHYHHGYPPHDHYDMDGDGDIDCPYDFDDKTDHNSSSSSGSGGKLSANSGTSSSNDSYIASQRSYDIGYADGYEAGKYEVPIWAWILIIVLSVLILVSILKLRKSGARISALQRENDRMEAEHQKIINSLNAELQDCLKTKHDITELNAQLSSLQKQRAEGLLHMSQMRIRLNDLDNKLNENKKELQRVITLRKRFENAPSDVTFNENGTPVCWFQNTEKPYGDYTVYLSKRSKIYHTDRYCASYNAETTHIFFVIDHYFPCKRCAESAFPFTTVPEWYDLKDK